jgi:hypothetical protein
MSISHNTAYIPRQLRKTSLQFRNPIRSSYSGERELDARADRDEMRDALNLTAIVGVGIRASQQQ